MLFSFMLIEIFKKEMYKITVYVCVQYFISFLMV